MFSLMELKAFIKKNVKPGEPLTSQGWNDIVNGVDDLYQFIAASAHVVTVAITNTEVDPERVRVTATRSTGAPVEAVRPILSSKNHTLAGLDVGAWTINAELAGYDTATSPVNVSGDGDIAIQLALKKVASFMPDLFGATLAAARTALSDASIPLVKVLDFNGRELPPTQPDEQNDAAPVLVQWPPPEAAVPAGGGARLVIAVPVQIQPAVAVPALTSLTEQEARKALESIGLVVGKVTIAQRSS
jgi:hypothetical protein